MKEPDQNLFEFAFEPKTKPAGIDLFAGAGGFSLGMEWGGIDVRAAVEYDASAALTYRMNHRRTVLLKQDIRTLSGIDLLRAARLKDGELDLLFGSPPCQGFSTSNTVNRGLDNPNSKLMNEFIRLTKETTPRVFLIENVPGLLSYKDFFIMLLGALENIGYAVRFLIMDAASYGVPQHRKRVLIQGCRNDLNRIPSFPPPTHFDPDINKKLKSQVPPSALAVKCFATNGFSKEEVRDLYWNNVLWIYMNKKTAGEVLDRAITELICETFANHINQKGAVHGKTKSNRGIRNCAAARKRERPDSSAGCRERSSKG